MQILNVMFSPGRTVAFLFIPLDGMLCYGAHLATYQVGLLLVDIMKTESNFAFLMTF
jgi:hypothetical protein